MVRGPPKWCGSVICARAKAEIKGAELFPQWVEGREWMVEATAKNAWERWNWTTMGGDGGVMAQTGKYAKKIQVGEAALARSM